MMSNKLMIPHQEFLFVSDTHFGNKNLPEEAKRRESFISFLRQVPADTVLFLLGDIFDFYFEYPSVIYKHYFDVFFALYETRSRGVPLHFLGGNHDCWTGPFLRDEIGVTIHAQRLLFEAQGRTILCAHGDELMPGDKGYKLLKALLRNRFVVSSAKLVHPDLLGLIARAVSAGSRSLSKKSQETLARRLSAAAFDSFFSEGNDVFIMGHVHFPIHQARKGKDFIVLGDWIDHFTFVRLRGGKISQEVFKG